MKKLALFALMATLSGSAFSGVIAPSATPADESVTTGDCTFIKTDFTMKVSAYVGLAYACSTTAAAVQAGSQKGKYVYGGGTSGGGVERCGTTEVSTANGYAATIASAGGDGCS